MAKKQEVKAAVVSPAKVAAKTVVRRKLNSFQRKSLSKESKRLFEGMGRGVMRAVLAAEQMVRKSNKTLRGPLIDA